MNITEALGWATTALEFRGRMWRQTEQAISSGDENIELELDEFYEAGALEADHMAVGYEEALKVLNTYGVVALQVDDECNVRMVNIKATSASEATSASNIRPPQGGPKPGRRRPT